MVFPSDRFFVWFAFALLTGATLFSCKDRKELIDEPLYEGPIVSMDSIYTKVSDSAEVVLILKAARQNNFEGGDKEWPKGLYLENLDRDGTVISTFRADYVYYTAKDNVYRSEGNVVVTNEESGDELNTEELFWNPSEDRFYTERYVTIQEAGDNIHRGEGLEANQDFSDWSILKPEGSLILDEEE